jgi:hypothetical protein
MLGINPSKWSRRTTIIIWFWIGWLFGAIRVGFVDNWHLGGEVIGGIIGQGIVAGAVFALLAFAVTKRPKGRA